MVISSYRNFELVVNKDSANPQQLSVQVLNSPVGNQAKPQFTSIPSSLQRDLRWLEERRLSVDEITELGETLANLLFPGEVRVLFIRSLDRLAPQQGLRLQLRLDPTLASVPWEYLYIQRGTGERDSSGFLALDPRISIVRYEALDLSGDFDKTPRSRRLLVALASPTDQDLLNLDQESTNIKNALQDVPGIEADFLQNATVQSLNDRLMTGADIFHFAGHGIFNMNPGTKTGEGALVLVGEDGKSAFMPADQVAMNLRGRGVQLVILGACHTGRRDEQNVWSGVVAALMRVGIPAAVAMQYKVWDDSAIAFGRSFYKALAAGLPLDQALSAGRLAVFNMCHPLRNDTERGKFWRDWGVPVLYFRADGDFVLTAIVNASERQAVATAPQKVVEQRFKEIEPRGQYITNLRIQKDISIIKGDNVGRDNIGSDKVGSDKITVGNISNSTGIAIGRSASANVRIINQLQDSNNPEAQRLADLLKQLQSIVTTEGSGLSPKNQEKALKHLDAIGKFGRDRQNSDLQDDAETALDALPTILSQGTGLNQTQIKSLLESIQEVLGL